MFDEYEFRDFVRRNGRRLKEVAGAMEMSPTTLYRKMSGQSDFTSGEISKCCRYFGCGLDEMYHIFFAETVSYKKPYQIKRFISDRGGESLG